MTEQSTGKEMPRSPLGLPKPPGKKLVSFRSTTLRAVSSEVSREHQQRREAFAGMAVGRAKATAKGAPSKKTEPMRHILNLAVIARNEMQGRMADEGHRKAFAALGAICETARQVLGVVIYGTSEP